MLRVSRQDLRGQNRNYSEEAAYFDMAGGALRFGHGAFGGALYAKQPLVRLEDNTFTIGLLPSAQPGVMTTSSAAREFIGGLALSLGNDHARFGVAGEWVRRDDRYQTTPAERRRTSTTSGDGVGATSACGSVHAAPAASVTVGGGLGFPPALMFRGPPDCRSPERPHHRDGGDPAQLELEGGLSASYEVNSAFHAPAAFGGHGDITDA